MKMKIILSACIIFSLAACKKDNSTIEKPVEQPLLQDGPLSAQLGKMIYLGDHGNNRSMPVWGRNSDELFITVSMEILRLDIAAKKVEVLENSVGTVTGKTNENSGVILLGKVNNEVGYHVFNFSSNRAEKIIAVAYNQSTLINIAGNNIFYYQSTNSNIPRPPCNGYCWPMPGPVNPSTFYHLDKQTQQITDLENKRFMFFSTDGSRAFLSSHLNTQMYVFDNTSRTIVDSFDMTNRHFYALFFHSGVLHGIEENAGNFTIKNFNTGQVIRQYQTNIIGLDNFRVSADGTKFYYSGGIFNTPSMKILLYDLATNTQKIIADLPYLQGGGRPFGYFVLSDDNKKMLITAGNDLYLKVIE